MAYRIETYFQAFEIVLNIKIDDKIKTFIKKLESKGHTEKSICFVIWKKQDKLVAFKSDSRFLSILENEINKWSWPKDDPRWIEYWKRKREENKAAAIKKEIDSVRMVENELSRIDRAIAKRPKTLKGYVYFIQGQCGGAIKIGYSLNPEERLRSLQTGYPDTLIILSIIPGDETIEKALHKEFEHCKLKGEWFRPDRCLIEKIKSYNVKVNQ